MHAVKKENVIEVTSRGGKEGMISFKGFNRDELDMMEGAMLGGHVWVRRDSNGRLEHAPAYKPLPDPVQDETMQPFWTPSAPEGASVQYELFDHVDELGAQRYRHSSPSITIQHICGYGYTPDNYRRETEQLVRFGFECLRSPRDYSGQYHELWFLSGLWRARGELREYIYDNLDNPKNMFINCPKMLESALRFLQRNCRFGTLDISVQRMAMVIKD
ncbi:MAG: hypothetical protein JWO43_523 [Candidatus Adlerbacteria bacterium]|nr:hypothetical protein [Candidatus Adlerbacteria bacterium]